MILLAGPCSMESRDVCFKVAETMKDLVEKYPLDYYFKTSFDKANRTSISSYRGLGIEKGLDILQEVKKEFNFKIVTDIHEPWQAEYAAQVADIIQIPAFLCRQTDLLVAAAKTGKTVNVKKAQFLAPWDMKNVVCKLEESGAHSVILCERGTSFGYNTFVVDMTSIPLMQKFGYPVIFDATHSVQKPGGMGSSSDGNREVAPYLAKAALAVGADGLFMEIHPDPNNALCDGPNMIALEDVDAFLENAFRVYKAVRS
ncbi:3-deoxy-8-phosphooctulonate synthase [Adlercreutzia sp. ZJ304]|uniref:3-deoxy-8-phosphooctulonate synthase n=1 Tax=Adlercreutzia sp. ZJ304 TaxID=2709791 RepID=UPI0013EB7DC7|nr:3-deoxy-8-phosphooctulonate synthase [Adlercreutzia sp. ZJ304]